MRWLALLFQVIIPGPVGFYLAYAMALGMPATPARNEIPFIIILGGAVIGVLTWISGLIADRITGAMVGYYLPWRRPRALEQ